MKISVFSLSKQDHVEKGGANGFHNKGYIDGNPAEPQEKYNRTGSMHY